LNSKGRLDNSPKKYLIKSLLFTEKWELLVLSDDNISHADGSLDNFYHKKRTECGFFCIKTDDVEGFGFESITSANNIPFKTLFEMGRDMKSLHIKRPENLFHFFL